MFSPLITMQMSHKSVTKTKSNVTNRKQKYLRLKKFTDGGRSKIKTNVKKKFGFILVKKI